MGESNKIASMKIGTLSVIVSALANFNAVTWGMFIYKKSTEVNRTLVQGQVVETLDVIKCGSVIVPILLIISCMLFWKDVCKLTGTTPKQRLGKTLLYGLALPVVMTLIVCIILWALEGTGVIPIVVA